MEPLAQYGIAGAALAALVYLCRFLVRAYIAASAKELSEQRTAHVEDARATRGVFVAALAKQQDVFAETLKAQQQDCHERHQAILNRLDQHHEQVMDALERIDGKLPLLTEKN